MRFLVITMFCFAAFQAGADVDCTTKTMIGEKRTEAKPVFKKTKDDKEVTSYETEVEGYIFTAIVRKSESPIIQQVGILDKSSNNRTVASFEGMKPEKPDAFLMAALANEKAKPPRFAKLTCQLKP